MRFSKQAFNSRVNGLYKAEIVPFTGRADELQALNTFLGDAHIAFRWWAITGPGGSGKSRPFHIGSRGYASPQAA